MIESARVVAASQLVHRFWSRLDQNDYPAILDMVTPDCRWFRGGAWKTGLEEIQAALAERPAGLFVRHVVATLVADEVPEGVECRYYLLAFSHRRKGEESPPFPVTLPRLILDYRSICVETATGWKVKSLAGDGAFRAE